MHQDSHSCHSTLDVLQDCSIRSGFGIQARIYQRPKSYICWCMENLGLVGGIRHIILRLSRQYLPSSSRPFVRANGLHILNLQPGELVQVKPIDQILKTLDYKRRYKGLLWMAGMARYCGTRQRVYKRVDRIMLESTGQLRKIKNTVLLEGAICDGSQFGGCDRSCLFFWNEAWLQRIGP